MRIIHCFPPTLETIVFFDLFDQPVPVNTLTGSLSNPHVCEKNGFYYLKGREALLADVSRKEAVQKKLWQKVDRFRWLFWMIPFVRMVGICNSLAMGTAKADSDIDLFIITAPRRLFIARLYLTFALHLFGMRRHGRKIARRFCLSFFVSEESLDLKMLALEPMDPYFAYWLHSVTPVTGLSVWERFFAANHDQHTPRPQFPDYKERSSFARGIQWLKELPFSTVLGDYFESFLQRWQLRRATQNQMHNKTSSIVLSPTLLKFHENDRREAICNTLIKSLRSLDKV